VAESKAWNGHGRLITSPSRYESTNLSTIKGMATIDPDKLAACPTCAAAVPEDFLEEHLKWHAAQHSETGQTGPTGERPNLGD
jgi:hypothetical protein